MKKRSLTQRDLVILAVMALVVSLFTGVVARYLFS